MASVSRRMIFWATPSRSSALKRTTSVRTTVQFCPVRASRRGAAAPVTKFSAAPVSVGGLSRNRR
jgi:hypothetical protein